MSSAHGAWRAPTPFTTERIGAVAIYCSDGRYGEQFDQFLHTHLSLPRYDRLAVPGGAAALAGHLVAHRGEAALLEYIQFLADTHALECVVLIAHQNCGFYLRQLRISETRLRGQQEEDMARSAEVIRSICPRLVVASYFASVDNGSVIIEPCTC